MLVKIIMCNKYGAVYNCVLKYFVNYPNWGVSVFLPVFPSVLSTVLAKILYFISYLSRVGFLPWQKVFWPWQKPNPAQLTDNVKLVMENDIHVVVT